IEVARLTVDDADIAEADRGEAGATAPIRFRRRCARSRRWRRGARRCRRRESPIRLALLVDFESDRRLHKLELRNLEPAMNEREELQFDGEGFQLNHVGR